MPLRPSWRSARRSSGSSIVVVSFGGGATLEQVAVEGELTDQRIDLPEREGRGRMALEVAADDLIAGPGEVEGDGARAVDGRGPVRAGEGEEALDAPDGAERILGVERRGELADIRADSGGAGEELEGRGRRPCRPVVGVLAVLAEMLALVLAQEGAGAGVKDAHGALVPLDLGVALGKHRGDLTLGGAVDGRVGPAGIPAIEVGLGVLEALEAQALERRALGVADPRLDFSLPTGISDTTRERVELGPAARARVEGEEADALAAVAEGEEEEPRAAVLPGAGKRTIGPSP